VLIGLAERFGLPIHAVGVGESIEDLQPFEALSFARALVGLED
jgi:fused signal recognition particle receptor